MEVAEEPVHYDFMRGTRSTALTMMIVCGPTMTATTPSNLSELLTSLLRRQASTAPNDDNDTVQVNV